MRPPTSCAPRQGSLPPERESAPRRVTASVWIRSSPRAWRGSRPTAPSVVYASTRRPSWAAALLRCLLVLPALCLGGGRLAWRPRHPPSGPVVQAPEMDLGQGCCLLMPRVDRELEEARAGYGTAEDHWGVAASSLVRAQGAVHAGDTSTVATMTAEILRHSEAIWYDVFVVPAMLLQAWVAELRNEPGAAEDAYRRALELAGRIGFVDHTCFAGSNALARGDTGQAEELCRRALAMAETLYRSVVEWSQTPRPRQVRELLIVVLAGSPGRRRCGAWRAWRQPAGTTTRPTTSRPAPPRWQRATAPRPTRSEKRLWRPERCAGAGSAGGAGGCARVEFREKLPARSSRRVSGCRGSGRRPWPEGRDARRRSSESVRGGRGPATRRMLGVPWQRQPRPRQPRGSRVRQRG